MSRHEPRRAAADDAERQGLFIPPALKAGKPDWRTWSAALFLPRLKRQTADTLPYFMGDNEANLAACRAPGALEKDDLAELERAIREQWGK